MRYKKFNNKIEIEDLTDFNIQQILECGQIFRFEIKDNGGYVLSRDKKADFKLLDNKLIIETQDLDYFEEFFDLNRDYSEIKANLKKHKFLQDAIAFGGGIRILKNDLFEMIVSFIISANNNIKRIKNSIEQLCEKFGDKKQDFYAFPTLNQLKDATIDDYLKIGLGYRAEQLYATIQSLTDEQIENIKTLPVEIVKEELIKLKGVGPKVANCIMLFGLNITETFPVDTWINKVYNKIYHTQETNRKKIEAEMISELKNLAGFAQQYLFYYFRENKINI